MGAKPSLKDDFYEAINYDWMQTSEIPDDRNQVSTFSQITDLNEERLTADLLAMIDNEALIPNAEMKECIKFYQMCLDFDHRSEQGITPAIPFLKQVENLTSLADLNQQLPDWITSGGNLPFFIASSTDFKDTNRHVIFIGAPELLLPDPSYYTEMPERKNKLIDIFKEMMRDLLALTGLDQEEAEEVINNYLAFDESLVPYVKTSEENADVLNSYHPLDLADFSQKVHNVPFKETIESLVKTTVPQIIDSELRFFDHFDELINEKTFPQIKSWLYVQTLLSACPYLSDEIRVLASKFNLALSGQVKPRDRKKKAYDLTIAQFSQVVGIFFGQKYLGDQAKRQVETMVKKMIAVYQERLDHNTWLTRSTIDQAIKKLESMTFFIGYPDQVEEIYRKFIVDPTTSVLENVNRFSNLLIERNFTEYQDPVDRTRWSMPGYQVNAYYSPTKNQIVFPAGILQAPMFSSEQSSSKNYGGVGCVIAHEISHAFDNNGSNFDENGNLKDWWTEEDFVAFKSKQEAMITEFDGLKIRDIVYSGKLTVAENIADNGGILAALSATKSEDDYNLQEFFANWVINWRAKFRPEYQEMLAAVDVHAPNKLRGNIQVQNFSEFYEAFAITEDDQMYRKPEDRVIIW